MENEKLGEHLDVKDILVKSLNVWYGPVHAVKGVELSIPAGSITAILGANGAGKSSTLKAFAGSVKYSGTIIVGDESIDRLPVHERVRKGLVLCPEGRGIFYHMTVKENLLAGAYTNKKANLDFVFGIFPFLKERLNQIAGTLSGGEQQMLAIARALMAAPKYLMLDEPSLGLAPIVVQRITDVIKYINENLKITVILVEQNTSVALSIAHHGYVLENGKVALQGRAEELRDNPVVREKYLGGVKK
ncbi:amino acid/amide ABC transporter ATP-binding protein 2, HAAT family [Fervidobacterium changbaicum]|uniref:ABC transporter ATP-binding protein n=1 Tax=Fervidobacterium changbaicum TaxID=310769 RepID=A0ABX5QU79_9BACT|nr:ABC transporter ATP-binding protein [Fervidobacterium changbaicum]QAV33980.1 ABC transporter ATP-binding protein [Fervidobacterium changbaicum]SDH25587.1 amino acid/amide ABC transporter ATP-binding protein 2, HAAT family [Fervidobacterium changbaicum]